MGDYPKIVLGKDTVADKEYLEIRDEAMERVKYNKLAPRAKLVAQKEEIEAKIAEIDAR